MLLSFRFFPKSRFLFHIILVVISLDIPRFLIFETATGPHTTLLEILASHHRASTLEIRPYGGSYQTIYFMNSIGLKINNKTAKQEDSNLENVL